MTRAVRLLLTIAVCLSVAQAADPGTVGAAWTGVVSAIGDSGSFTVVGPAGAQEVVPAGVIVPARGQAMGPDACGLIYAAAWHRDVLITPQGDAAHGVIRARIRLPDGSDLGEQLVWAGLARCAGDARACDPRLLGDEAQAKREGRGIWRPHFTPAQLDGEPDAATASPADQSAQDLREAMAQQAILIARLDQLAAQVEAPKAQPDAAPATVAAPPVPAAAQPSPAQALARSLAITRAVAPTTTADPAPASPSPSAATPAARDQSGSELDQQTLQEVDRLVGRQDP